MNLNPSPEIILRDGKPVAVILNIEVYQEMLERLEQTEDLKALDESRKRSLQFRELDEFLSKYSPNV